MSSLTVLDPGVLCTIQDLGRADLGHLGVPVGGAADRRSLRIANALLANLPGDACLEITGGGARFRAEGPVAVAVAGADLGAAVDGWPVRPGATAFVRPGGILTFGGAEAAGGGLRAYLSIAGGFAVPSMLGSRATLASSGLGGIDGREVRAGDRLPAGAPGIPELAARSWPTQVDPLWLPERSVGLLPGPDTDRCRPAVAQLTGAARTVARSSDRMGLRLDGPPLPGGDGSAASFGVLPGAVQLPPDGIPIVLLADHQTVGGYPVIGYVATVDLPWVGQAVPGTPLVFTEESVPAARARLMADEAVMATAAELLRANTRWDCLHLDAGG